ncbi:MAG: DUF2007 domain-containing protein [Gammaproteobacteria bacterium]
MREVYRAANITEAHIVAGMLRAREIEAHVAGHYLQGGVGELAPTDLARVLVADDRYEAARAHVRDYASDAGALVREQASPIRSGWAIGLNGPWVSVAIVFFVIGVFALLTAL